MDYIRHIQAFQPVNDQEEQDKEVILNYIRQSPQNVLLRENQVAHITSSGFLMNEPLDKVLLVHHNIRNVWAWSGGHADGDEDLLHVAMKEASEETGVKNPKPLRREIISLDILPVFGHRRRGRYVNGHLHLSVAYILICDEGEAIRPKPDENTGVAWFSAADFTAENFDGSDVYLYNKLIRKARAL